ncbi:probable caffeoyl-CoA O-methyltransferase, partial [Tanacetum coccineum]
DMDREAYEIGRPVIQKAGLEHKIDFIESQALPALDKLLENPKNEGSFDYAFVDADKINYINYHERIMKLVKVNGIVVYDNTLWFGSVAQPEEMVLKEFKEGRVSTIEFNKSLAADPRIDISTFASNDGLDQVLERGPWMIRNTPLILNKWTPSLSLKKDKVTKVPVWVKLLKVPLAYLGDGLSLIATQVGKPIILDAFTSSMCEDSWGRINFARALVEISADNIMKQEASMAIPREDGIGYTKEVIRVEYEWKPPHCVDCKC